MQSKIAELLHQYFELGVAEGREGRNHDTEDGDAQRVLSEIEAEITTIRQLLSEADKREAEAESRAHAEESTATRYANEIIELRAELAKTSALLVVQADRAEAAEVQVDSLHREIDGYRAVLKSSAQVADRAAEEFLSDAKAWASEKMPAAASQAKAQAKAAEMVAERIRALQSEER